MLNLYLYPFIFILPLLASLVSGLLGRKIGVSGSQFINCTSLVISSLLIIFAFYDIIISNKVINFTFGTWLESEILKIEWEFLFDQLNISLGLAVTICSALIHIYTLDYLAEDPHNQRFFSYLTAFTAGMLVLIFGGNYFVMFIGWEAIGVVSYLLINYYFTRIQANKASILALTMNRGGDMLLSIGFFAIFSLFGSLNYSTVFTLTPYINEKAITIIGLLLLGGALAKSANIPLHSWLPGSMEAPTPVSALLHAATLVTAGIYLLVRSSPILEYGPTTLLIITLIGSTTAFVGATCGLLQNDLKAIIAFSTISQLGYMMLSVGLSQFNAALFHTINHSFFKALLFLGAGAVIHSLGDQQDVRKMGGLIKFLPFIYSVMLVGTLSLLATPFLTGYYSKDLILELAYGKYSFSGIYAYILGTITAGITAFYSFRLISLVYITTANGPKQSYLNIHESNLWVIIPLLLLSIFSIFFGYVMSDLFVGMGSDFLGNSIFIHPNNISTIEAEFSINPIIKLLPFILSFTGSLLAVILYNWKNTGSSILIDLTNSKLGRNIYGFFNGKYYFDIIYNNYFISKTLHISYKISKEIDRGALELLGPYGISNTMFKTGNTISKLDTGIITNYALFITLALLILIYFLYFNVLFPGVLGISNTIPKLIIILFYTLIASEFMLENFNKKKIIKN